MSRYQLVRKLATGGMAEVFLAKAVGLGRFEKHLVVKRILPQLARRDSFVRMFIQEAKVAASLAHPNVVQIFDIGEEDGNYFIAMEYIDGINLRTLSRWAAKTATPVPLPVAARIISLACEGLAYVHERVDDRTGAPLGLIHRDVSSDNVMVARSGGVKILDFGVARVESDEQTGVGMLKGKVAYMPVEQLRTERLDLRVDVYALGVVLYELLCGRKPYERPNEVALISALLSEPPTPVARHRADLPVDLVAIVERATARDREKRFPTCRAFQAALEAFITRQGQPVTTSHLGQLVQRALSSGFPSVDRSSHPGGSHEDPVGVAPGSDLKVWFEDEPRPVAGDEAASAASPEPATTPAGELGAQSKADAPEGGTPTLPQGQVGLLPSGELSPLPSRPPGRIAVENRSPAVWDVPLALGATPEEVAAWEEKRAAALRRARSTGRTETPPRSGSPPPHPSPRARVVPPPKVQPTPPPLPASGPRGSEPSRIEALRPRPSPGAPSDGLSASRRDSPVPGTLSAPPAPPLIPPVPPFSAPRPPAPPAHPRPATRDGWLQRSAVTAPPVAVVEALRATAARDRSWALAVKFPAVAARLQEVAPQLAPAVLDACACVIDAALLAEKHSLIDRLLERVQARPGGGGAFGQWLSGELASPLRMTWLVDRLRDGLPVEVESLVAWLSRLGPSVTPMVLQLIDGVEPGPVQDLLARVLAQLCLPDAAPVISRLEEASPRSVAPLCLALELSGASDRHRTFARLLGRRDPTLTMAVMTGRAKARGADVLTPLEAALGDRLEDIRLHAVKLLGELESGWGSRLLLLRTKDPAFEKRSEAERAAYWTAIGKTRDPAVLADIERLLAERTGLLGKKRSLAVKLPLVAGLAASGHDDARAMLERIQSDPAQPEEVREAAQGVPSSSSSGERSTTEQRLRLRRSICLDLAYLLRAASATALPAGMLDGVLFRLWEELGALVVLDGRAEVVLGGEAVTVNGAPLSLRLGAEDVASRVAQAIEAGDVRSLKAVGGLTSGELWATVAKLTDPDGSSESTPHLTVTTASGRLLEPHVEPPLHERPLVRVQELYGAAVELLLVERDRMRAGRAPALARAGPLLDEWVQLSTGGGAPLLSFVPVRPSEQAFAVHAANTAMVGLAFGADLHLGKGTLREIAELALFWTLAEVGIPPERLSAPGAAPSVEARLRLAALFLAQPRSHRALSCAVAALDAGVDAGDGRAPGLVASIVALAEAWDALAVGSGLGHPQAVEILRSRSAARFDRTMLDLFSSWALAQVPPAGAGGRP